MSLTSTYLINRIPSRVIDFKSPLNYLLEFFPKNNFYSKLPPRVFGCVSYIHIHKQQRTKLDPRALKCIFIGYSATQKGYKCYHPASRKFFVSKDVTFNEKQSFFYPTHLQGENILREDKYEEFNLFSLPIPVKKPEPPAAKPVDPSAYPSPNPHFDSTLESDLPSSQINQPGTATERPFQVYTRRLQPDHATLQVHESEPIQGTEHSSTLLPLSPEIIDIDQPIAIRKGVRKCTENPIYPIAHHTSFKKFSPSHRTFLSKISTTQIPQTLHEALGNKNWEDVMREEMNALEKNKTWEVHELPKGKKTVGCKWVFALKYNADGSLERYKARLVAKGYTQTYGVDYQDTFAPVAKMNTIRILISLAANFGWFMQQYDVKNAFLHGDLEEEVYMDSPPGFNGSFSKNQVCRLKKALYGLKQSPRAWFGRFTKVMKGMGYQQSQGDHTLFIKHSAAGGVTALIVYVDDIIVTGNDPLEKDSLQKKLAAEFEIKELGKLKYFLGIEVAQSEKGIFISQQKYVLDLLKETGMIDCKPCDTPMEPGQKLDINKEEEGVDKGQYQRLVGKLIYLSHTRPDIAFAVSVISQFMHNPKNSHLQSAYRVLRYLKATPGKGILYRRNGTLKLECYTDADWAGAVLDRRSTSGYCTLLGGNLVTWRSKKQSVVSRSSAESEFRSMALGICELLWLKIILEDLKVKWEGPIRLYCDNKSAINIAHNPVQHDRTKHVEVDRHFIKEKLDSGLICTPYVQTSGQLADILTKALSNPTFRHMLDKLGMIDLYQPA